MDSECHFYSWKGEERELRCPVPQEELTAIGAVIVSWSRFEQLFDMYHDILRWSPDVQALGEVPYPFKKRATRVHKAAEMCFPGCPKYLSVVASVCNEAKNLLKKRNSVTHAFWQQRDQTLELHEKANGPCDRYSADRNQLYELAAQIKELEYSMICILLFPQPDLIPIGISLSERRVVQEHYSRHQPRQDPSADEPTTPALPPLMA